MTYDMTGAYNSCTGHHSPLLGKGSADTAVDYLMDLGVPAGKIAIGSPLYSHGWKLFRENTKLVGAAAKGFYAGDLTWRELEVFEKAAVEEGMPGWHMGYDDGAQAAYLWNNDPSDEAYLTFYTYENARSLAAKLAYINERELGGLIVWQVHGDNAEENWPMITQMHETLKR